MAPSKEEMYERRKQENNIFSIYASFHALLVHCYGLSLLRDLKKRYEQEKYI